jgi:NAD(P)-dependent dehydrogenase (short-subunit alcohol dehydrogenase family)
MVRALITGANRGIGLEMARRMARRGDTVFATYREAARSEALMGLARASSGTLTAVEMDVRDLGSIDRAHGIVAGRTDALDVLVNNAGVGAEGRDFADARTTRDLGHLEADDMLRMLHTNTVAPIVVAQRFMPLLKRGRSPKVVNVTSQMGSIAMTTGGSYAYRASKAALNMLTRNLAIDLRGEGIAVAMVHPGCVRTDMGGPDAPVGVEESVEGMIRVIDDLTLERTGRFWDHRGGDLPW